MNVISDTKSTANTLPQSKQDEIGRQMTGSEQLVCWMEGDLDTKLHFNRYLLAITNTRILSKAHSKSTWQSWSYHKDLKLQRHDHAGVGNLELFDGESRLGNWRYTLANNTEAQKIATSFELQLSDFIDGKTSKPVTETTCPNCQAILEPGQEECPVCSVETYTPPSTWVLFRLWQFAQPYKGQLLLGFMLTLAATAATMVPPYLTMPLMDKVLIPYQNGTPIDYFIVALLLAGLFGSALIAWGDRKSVV